MHLCTCFRGGGGEGFLSPPTEIGKLPGGDFFYISRYLPPGLVEGSRCSGFINNVGGSGGGDCQFNMHAKALASKERRRDSRENGRRRKEGGEQ